MFEGANPEISVELPGLTLRRLTHEDAGAVHNLVNNNRKHLTQFGDYLDLVERSRDEWIEVLRSHYERELAMGMFVKKRLIGTVSLICHKPRVFGLGYWLDAHWAGHGYATCACRSLMDFARVEYDAKEVWAGIKSRNVPSIAVAERLGLRLARTQESHLSYMLSFGSD